MKLLKPRQRPEPIQHFGAIKLGIHSGAQRIIGRPRPFTEICYKSVLLWVEVDIENELKKIAVRRDLDSPKSLFEQTASAAIGFVNGFGVGVEQIGKC